MQPNVKYVEYFEIKNRSTNEYEIPLKWNNIFKCKLGAIYSVNFLHVGDGSMKNYIGSVVESRIFNDHWTDGP